VTLALTAKLLTGAVVEAGVDDGFANKHFARVNQSLKHFFQPYMKDLKLKRFVLQ
jgi:hypothetical protein